MLIIRLMEEKDLDSVCMIEEAIFSIPWKRQDFQEMLEWDKAVYLVAEENDKIIGTCGLRNIAGEGEITNVAVCPEHRRCGVGESLLKQILIKGQQSGIIDFTLEVRKSNLPAIRLYQKHGFVTEGIRPRFYSKPIEDAWIMWKRQER